VARTEKMIERIVNECRGGGKESVGVVEQIRAEERKFTWGE